MLRRKRFTTTYASLFSQTRILFSGIIVFMSYYKGKKVVVTGGSSGIGRSVALDLARRGADVAIWARRQTLLDATLEELQGAAVSPTQRFVAVSVDVTDRMALKTAATQTIEALGGLDVLVNNSGFAQPVPLDVLTDEDIDQMTNVNYLGHVNVTRAFLPHFKAQGSGDICNVTSMLGFMGFYGYTAYCGSKFAIVGFSEGLRQELLLYNVRVTVYYPPTTDTPGLLTENKVKTPETWAIEGKATAYSSDDVARSLTRSIEKGRFTNMIGFSNWAIYYAHRFMPGVVRWVIDRDLRKHQQKQLPPA